MKRLITFLLISLILAASWPLAAEATGTIAMSTAAARRTEKVTVTGHSSPEAWVTVKVVDSQGNILVFDAVKADETGAYSLTFTVPDGAGGVLRIIAGYGNNVAVADLRITVPSSPDSNARRETAPQTTQPVAVVAQPGKPEITRLVNANKSNAATELETELAKDIFAGTGTTTVTVSILPGVSSYTLELPAGSLSNPANPGTLTFSTPAGSVTILASMLAEAA